MRRASHRYCLLASSILALPFFAVNLKAQQQATDVLEEVIVTAQKREENLQTTPISITAVNADVLEARGVVSSERLAYIAPNVEITPSPSSPSGVDVYIRGLGQDDSIFSVDSPITVYVDGIPLSRTAGNASDLVDLDRVEVLRGPQGTLYGRNTVGGAVNFITAKPSDEFGFEQKFTGGSFSDFESRTRLDTGKIGDSGLKIKLAYVHKDLNGFVQNTLESDAGKWPGSDHVDAFRGALSWDQGGRFRADYTYAISGEDATPWAFQAAMPYPAFAGLVANSALLGGNPYEPSLGREGALPLDHDDPIRDETQNHGLTLEYDLNETLKLKSLTGYGTLVQKTPAINLYGSGGLVGIVASNPGGFAAFEANPAAYLTSPQTTYAPGPVTGFWYTELDRQHQVTEEIDALGTAFDKKLDYALGAFYYHEEAFSGDGTSSFTLALPLPTGTIGINSTTAGESFESYSTSKAVFGQGTYHFTDQIDLTAGIRYTHDDRHLVQTVPFAQNEAVDYGKANWAVSPDYKITPDIMAYLRIATGYRSGGLNARTLQAPFQPENATSYEGGFKTEFFDHKLRFNIDYYFINYTNLQLTQFQAGTGGATALIVNAGKAHYQGVEAEAQAILGYGFSLDGNVGTSNRKYLVYDVLNPATNQIVNIGNTVHGTNAPDVTASAGLQYEMAPTPIGQLSARLDYHYQSKIYFHPSNFAYSTPFNDYIASPGHGLLDARVALGHIKIKDLESTLAVWCRNCANQVYRVGGIDFGPTLGYAESIYGIPRTVGVDFTTKF
jgi:iron complex outermembrane receptor protein